MPKLKIPTLPCVASSDYRYTSVGVHMYTVQISLRDIAVKRIGLVHFQHGSGTQQEPGQGAQALQVAREAQEPEPGQGWLRRRFCNVRGEHAGEMMLLGVCFCLVLGWFVLG